MQVRLYDSKLINKNVFVAFTFQSLDSPMFASGYVNFMLDQRKRISL